MNPPYNGELESQNEMVVDHDDFGTEQSENEKNDVAIINPDHLGSDTDMSDKPRADDFDSMKDLVLPPLDVLPPILETQVHTWHIQNWRTLPRKEHGPKFMAGGFPWRVLMFPTGNNVDQASFYLEQGFEEGEMPEDWSCCVQFGLVLWNCNDPTLYQYHTAHHRFTKEEGDWGFTRFVELRKLWSTSWDGSQRPLVENEEANMTAFVRIVEDETGVLWHNFNNYDSKKETGYVGLKNQGATCYLNSLLQSLYFTNAFRKAVYQIPTQSEETLTNSAYTLQRLFYQLQISNNAVSTNELTKSFGWETRHIFEQQDVQELSRKLMERMEEKMKGTEAENFLHSMFAGKLQTYIDCINVEYASRRTEDFWDVQLNVQGNKDVVESFKEYIQVEVMDGENQYYASEKFKLQDARKGVIFESFPDVLNLQLKRFTYDIEKDAMTKLNDRYEFPEKFDAAPFLSESADKSESYIYQLHSVLVHSGDLNAGHYYAFIKPTKDGWFYRYDDDKVTKATMREVLEDNYGGEYLPPAGQGLAVQRAAPIIRHNSAYMLVYIRQTRADQILLPVTQEDYPPHLEKRLEEEAAERDARKKEREESHLYLNTRVITDDTFRAYGGTDLTAFDLKHDVDPSAARSYRLLKSSTILELAEKIAQDTNCDPRAIRLWCMVNRQNKTVRPDMPIIDTNMTIEEAHTKLAGNKALELRLWAEKAEEISPDGMAIWPSYSHLVNGTPPKTDLIVIFLKWFDVDEQCLKGVGHIYISREKKVEELMPAILKKMGWEETTSSGERLQLKLFEEIKPNMIEPMKSKQTLKAAELQDGDIVCFQRITDGRSSAELRAQESDRESINSRTHHADRIEDARTFYDFLANKRPVRFHPHPRMSEGEPFQLILSSKHTYDQIAARVGDKVGCLPTHLRFSTVSQSTGNPKTTVKRGQSQTLLNILNPPYQSFNSSNQRTDALYYEILEISLSEYDTKKMLKVIWLSEGVSKEDVLEVLVPKNGTVSDLVAALIKKGQLEDEETAGPIRIYEVSNNRLHKELIREHPVQSITDYVQLVAERIPKEDLQAGPTEFIVAFHYHNDPNKSHGIPFKFRILENEKFSDTKVRLQERLGIKGKNKNFDKIKFSVVKGRTNIKPTYLTDDDVLWEHAAQDDDLLGLDHLDKTRPKQVGTGDLFLR